MTEGRRHRDFSKDSKIAALLCLVFDIPHEHQKLMHEGHVLSLVQWDHFPIRYEAGGSNHFSNARPLLTKRHLEKTTKEDHPEMARGRDVRASVALHQAKLALKDGNHQAAGAILATVEKRGRLKPRSKMASRPFPKQHRPMQSRGFQRRQP